MKWKIVSVTAIVLWLITAGIFAWYFVYGQIEVATDKRMEIQLTPEERDFVLLEMRTLLTEFQKLLDKLAQNKVEEAAVHLSNMGMKMAADDSAALLAKLPLAFKSMGMGLHKRMDELAAMVRSKKLDRDGLLKEIAKATAVCVSCHSTYRLSLEPKIKFKK